MEKLLGYPKVQVLKRMKIRAFFKPELFSKFKQDMVGSDFGGKNRLFFYETSMLSNEKKDIPVRISGFILSRDGIQNSMVLFVGDLRDLRTLEQQVTDQARLLHREKMISLGRLAASMVHEINNPLSGILNYIRLMIRISQKSDHHTPGPKKDLRSESEQIRDRFSQFNAYLKIIESETQRCSDLVSGLLKFSRKTDLEQKDIDVTGLIEHSLLLCSHKIELSNIVLKKNLAPDIPPVYGDFNQLEQCVINLIFNAVDAMENGGILEIWTRFNAREHLVSIGLKDNGKGISEEDKQFLFEPFFTTKNEGYGVGLGLSLAYGIIERHHGSIAVESRLNEGSEFIIHLPCKNTQEKT
jgi:signal transduction histidine kinase